MKPRSQTAANSERLGGLDLARFLAFVGMVVVNFNVVMTSADAIDHTSRLASAIGALLAGKAAATFVALAGIGLGLAAARHPLTRVRLTSARRALFLMAIGLVNCTIFEADILHFYAAYFLFALPLLTLSSRLLVAIVVALSLGFVALTISFNYDAGWNWDDLSYRDFWSVSGFTRNLFFNGWHPVIPWLGFVLFGIVLSRLPLSARSTQIRMIGAGVAALVIAQGLSTLLSPALSGIDAELPILLTTEPVPPMPLYVLTGCGAAAATIGLCLLLAQSRPDSRLLRALAPAGRQTLSLYIAHIVIGMGLLQTFDMIGNQSADTALYAALLFSLFAAAYSWLWARFFKRGPIEYLMRATAG